MKVKATGDHSDPEVRLILAEISSWAPRRGPNWAAFQGSIRGATATTLRVYAIAGVALAAILLTAFFAMSGLNLADFSTPVVSHIAP